MPTIKANAITIFTCDMEAGNYNALIVTCLGAAEILLRPWLWSDMQECCSESWVIIE